MRIRRKFKGYFSKDKYFFGKIKFFKDKKQGIGSLDIHMVLRKFLVHIVTREPYDFQKTHGVRQQDAKRPLFTSGLSSLYIR